MTQADEGQEGVESLFEHAGGEVGVHRLEATFYEMALADPILRPVFPHREPAL